jgi:sirohydrochlorin ferrochelatase
LQPFAAYFLVFHGSPDPRPQATASQLAHFFAERVQHSSPTGETAALLFGQASSPLALASVSSTQAFSDSSLTIQKPLVGIASLECTPLPLHQQMNQFGNTLLEKLGNEQAQQAASIAVLPLFLLAGVHVTQDIPAEVALAERSLPPNLRFVIKPHLGSHVGLRRLITERMATLPIEAWVLLAHGSRRSQANQAVEALAEHLGALAAYWAVPPDLESRLSELAQLGYRSIGILPYFLFRGRTTDAIARTVKQLSHKFPTLHLTLTDPIDASSELADLLVDLTQDRK